MKNKIALESLSLDLKRVAVGYENNSLKMAQRFLEEAIKRKNEVNTTTIKPYMRLILEKVEKINSKSAEDALMLSSLIQNYARKFL